jgi:hypothetical protein
VQHTRTPEKRKKNTIKSIRGKETEMEIDYFIKIEKRNVQNIAKTALFPQKLKQKSQRKT